MKRLVISMLALCAAVAMPAMPVMPKIFSDNMVLQRHRQVAFWGTAKKNTKVTVSTSWSKETFSVKSDDEGKWSLKVQTPAAGGPYTVTVSDGEKLTFENVLIGEVWLCSGQSNMEMPMKGFSCQPVEGAADYILAAKPERPIRMFNVKRVTSYEKKDDVEGGTWLVHDPNSVAICSATAYYFADLVQSVTGVPVGLVISNWGGTCIQTWLDEETIRANTDADLSYLTTKDLKEKDPKRIQNYPTMLFNSMINPLIPYTMKGIIWYQGEANRLKPEEYKKLQAAYAQMMRNLWDDQNMPFYFTQIASYNYGNPQKLDAALFRDAQTATLETIPHSGMAVTIDVGDDGCIHPAKKKEVGQRLAYLALYNDYGAKAINPNSPVYSSFEVRGNEIAVIMKVDGMGLAPLGRNLATNFVDGKEYVCFEVAGEDKVFHPADKAVIERSNKVIVSCKDVPAPVAVRYCFHNCAVGNLYNCSGVPAAPFRTDNW